MNVSLLPLNPLLQSLKCILSSFKLFQLCVHSVEDRMILHDMSCFTFWRFSCSVEQRMDELLRLLQESPPHRWTEMKIKGSSHVVQRQNWFSALQIFIRGHWGFFQLLYLHCLTFLMCSHLLLWLWLWLLHKVTKDTTAKRQHTYTLVQKKGIKCRYDLYICNFLWFSHSINRSESLVDNQLTMIHSVFIAEGFSLRFFSSPFSPPASATAAFSLWDLSI